MKQTKNNAVLFALAGLLLLSATAYAADDHTGHQPEETHGHEDTAHDDHEHEEHGSDRPHEKPSPDDHGGHNEHGDATQIKREAAAQAGIIAQQTRSGKIAAQ